MTRRSGYEWKMGAGLQSMLSSRKKLRFEHPSRLVEPLENCERSSGSMKRITQGMQDRQSLKAYGKKYVAGRKNRKRSPASAYNLTATRLRAIISLPAPPAIPSAQFCKPMHIPADASKTRRRSSPNTISLILRRAGSFPLGTDPPSVPCAPFDGPF